MSDPYQHVGFVAPEPADIAPLFPGYDIQSLIAVGGMGAVYRAVQRSLDRTVALKILPMEFSKDATFCAGFEAEAKAMARLNHPNLIGVFDFGEVNGMLYIIMEYVPGKSLYHSAYGQAVDPREVIRLVSGICHGLAHAHENGILHRDIKPSNILLDLNAQPKIGDFGLARPVERKIEEGEEIFGTPHYTAPEVVNAPHSVDYRADIFSVGVLLHELLTSKLPADDPRPASLIVRCDTRFDAIIRRATQPLAAARYASATEIANDLQAIASSLAHKTPHRGTAAAPRRVAPVRRPSVVRKSSNNSFIGFAVVLVLGIVAAVAFMSKKPTPPAPTPVVNVPLSTDPTDLIATKSSEPDVPELIDPVSPQPSDATGFGSSEPPRISNESPESPMADTDEESSIGSTFSPKMDMDAFFTRARKIMQERARAPIANFRTNLKTNFADFERSVEKSARKLKLAGDDGVDTVMAALAEIQTTGIIPDELDSSFEDLDGIDAIHRSCLTRQVGIHDTLREALTPLSRTYIVGLEKQLQRSQAENDVGAVAFIQSEIEKTKADPQYFTDLMLGKGPESAATSFGE